MSSAIRCKRIYFYTHFFFVRFPWKFTPTECPIVRGKKRQESFSVSEPSTPYCPMITGKKSLLFVDVNIKACRLISSSFFSVTLPFLSILKIGSGTALIYFLFLSPWIWIWYADPNPGTYFNKFAIIPSHKIIINTGMPDPPFLAGAVFLVRLLLLL